MNDVRKGANAGATAVLALACFASGIGCSGSSSQAPDTNGADASAVTCGPGTVLSNGVCVVSQDGGVDASLDASDSATTSDAAAEAGISDPCPNPNLSVMEVDCDPSCASGNVVCGETCSGFRNGQFWTTVVQLPPNDSRAHVIRTPDHPGTSADCKALCGDDFVYAIGIKVRGAHGVAQVTPPWSIYVPQYSSGDACTGFDAGLNPQCVGFDDGSYFIVSTKDPDAPARDVNLWIQQSPNCR